MSGPKKINTKGWSPLFGVKWSGVSVSISIHIKVSLLHLPGGGNQPATYIVNNIYLGNGR